MIALLLNLSANGESSLSQITLYQILSKYYGISKEFSIALFYDIDIHALDINF